MENTIESQQAPTIQLVPNPVTVTVPTEAMRHALALALGHASKDDTTRRNLCAVLFELRERGKVLRLVATDGHRLAMVDLGSTGPEHADKIVALISRDDVSAMLKALPKGRDQGVAVSFGPGQRFAFEPLGAPVSLTMHSVDETFPPYESVIPGLHKPVEVQENGGFVWGMNPAYLAESCKLLAPIAGKGSSGKGIQCRVFDNMTPMRIDVTSADETTTAVVVIMPMRI